MQNILKVPMDAELHWSDIDELIEELYQIDDKKLDELGHNYPHEWLQEHLAEDLNNLVDFFKRLLASIQYGESAINGVPKKGFGFVERAEGNTAYLTMIMKCGANLFVEKIGDVPDEEEEDEDEE